MQIKASFRKEILAFFRTNKFLIVAIVIIGWAIVSPLIIVGSVALLEAMEPLYDAIGMDISAMTGMLDATTVSMGVYTGITNTTQVGLIVYLLLINSFAGGEQVKRSVIIPRSSGLRNFCYVFPKYIVFPAAAFFLTVIGAFASWGISALVYDVHDVAAMGVLLGGALAGISMMFYVCCHLTLGTATSKPGMSAAVCITAAMLLPDIFSFSGADLIYNPFTLNYLGASLVHETAMLYYQQLDVIMSVVVAFVLMLILYFIALFVQNAQKVDNRGNEIRL